MERTENRVQRERYQKNPLQLYQPIVGPSNNTRNAETLHSNESKQNPSTLLSNKRPVSTAPNVFFIPKTQLLHDILLLRSGAIEFSIDPATHFAVLQGRDIHGLVLLTIGVAALLVGALLERIVEEDAALPLDLLHDTAATVVLVL